MVKLYSISARPRGYQHGLAPKDAGLVPVDEITWEEVRGISRPHSLIHRNVDIEMPSPKETGAESYVHPDVLLFVNLFVESVKGRPYSLTKVVARMSGNQRRPNMMDVYQLLSKHAPYVQEKSTPKKRRAFLKAIGDVMAQDATIKAVKHHARFFRFIVLVIRAGFEPREIADAWGIHTSTVNYVIEEWMNQ